MKLSGYNIMRDDSALLQSHIKSPPSFSIHLYPSHWTLNNGHKFLYTSQVSSILEDIRAFRIPADFLDLFDAANVPYYDGCLIVELLDYRPSRVKDPILEQPDVQRVVLHPSPETVWADICLMNQKLGNVLTDADALEIESRILMLTSHPLCLEPDPRLTRVVNSALRATTPSLPNSLKRKATAMVDHEEDEAEKAKRLKFMQFMNPQANKQFHPSWRIFKAKEALASKPPEPAAKRLSSVPPATRPPSVVQVPHAQPSVTIPVTNQPSHTSGSEESAPKEAKPVAPSAPVPANAHLPPQSHLVPKPVPVNVPQFMQAVPNAAAPQLVPDPSQRSSPVKQLSQPAPSPRPHRPPSSQPVPAAAIAANVSSLSSQPPNVTQQGQATPAAFQPPLPHPNFLNPPPIGKRRPSQAKPNTPVTPTQPLPQPQIPVTATPQQRHAPSPIQAQQQPTIQHHSGILMQHQQQQPQLPQHISPATPVQNPIQLQQAQVKPHPGMNIAQAAQQQQLAQQNMMQMKAALMQGRPQSIAQHNRQSGRNTPSVNHHSSPIPSPAATAVARSPMISQQHLNSPLLANQQMNRSSPLVPAQSLRAPSTIPQMNPNHQAQQILQQQQFQAKQVAMMQQQGQALNFPQMRHIGQMNAGQINPHAMMQMQRVQAATQQLRQTQAGQLATQQQLQQQHQHQQAQQQQAGLVQQHGQEQPPMQQFVQMQPQLQPQLQPQMQPQMFNFSMPMQPNMQSYWLMGGMQQQIMGGQQQIGGVPNPMAPQQMQGIGRTMPGSLQNR